MGEKIERGRPWARRIAGPIARRLLGTEAYARWHIRWLELRSNRHTFGDIYRNNLWGSEESVSGTGSTLELSAALREQLPEILAELEAESLLDAGCGDFNWLKTVDLGGVKYIGIDVVAELIRSNAELYGCAARVFMTADITRDRLPAADAVLCRHCLIHLSNRQVRSALRNLAATGAKYLLASTSPNVTFNRDIWPGSFRPVNLEIAPFNLPRAARLLNDSIAGGERPELGLWRFAELNLA
ncbi:MAG TPA: class I SAM-dependent methyltransferase [Candidatus Binataceae bacterium]|nr:class I SAM-dependent methyltransferase [Candidatus Binataceae bacterium]